VVKVDIFLIDAVGPFFRNYKKQRINWSKIPFHNLRLDPEGRRIQFDRIAADMRLFASKVSKAGYNSVSLDDVAHLTPDPCHGSAINNTIHILIQEYRVLFKILKDHGLNIYLTMDVLSFSPGMKTKIAGSKKKGLQFIIKQVESVFADFPEISGIIFRIGESDGRDVKGDFKSELFLRTPREVNTLIRELLPVFERHGRTLILRSWTVGAYQIGDFIWHRRTMARVLRGIDSPNFILSMKYGESDFFRYLPLNKHFFRLKVRKIIELQAKREYEGCGEYPSFVGWDYHEYARQIESAQNIAGISVWCQTGGWVPFRRLTFLQKEGIWNELNSYVTLKVFKEKWSVEESVTAFCQEINCPDPQGFLEFLRLDDEVIKELLYIREVAERKIFFRRVRIPPLLTVYWNNIFINDSVRKILQHLVENHEGSIQEGYNALEKIKRMKTLAEELGLSAEDIQFMNDTFYIIALARSYYFLPDNEETVTTLKKAKKKYKVLYPKKDHPRYRIKTNYKPFPLRIASLALLSRFCLRNKRGYRIIDHLFTLHLLGVIYRLFVFINPEKIPAFVRKQAMGIGTIFR
jgi:hypothetical protein